MTEDEEALGKAMKAYALAVIKAMQDKNHVEVDRLIDEGVEKGFVTEENKAMHIAIREGDTDEMQRLIDRRPPGPDKELLQVAMSNGIEEVKRLLAKGAESWKIIEEKAENAKNKIPNWLVGLFVLSVLIYIMALLAK